MKRLSMKAAALGVVLLMSAQPVLAADHGQRDYEQHWAKEAIEKWNGYEVVKGYENGDFRPNNPITRAELAAILDRVFKFPEVSSLGNYMDIIASPDKWYVAPVSKVTALGLMHIDGFLFEPNALVTREEAVYAIAKAYELAAAKEEKTSFKDENQISSWALEAVSTLAHSNYITGTPEGNFMPQNTLTRAEVVTMLNNITSELITKSGTYTQSIKGNVVINSSDVVLKDLTIEGDLYITSGVKNSTLDNVTVTGTVYVKGGSLQISGQYKEVHLSTGAPVSFTAGTIEKLVVAKAGSSLTVAQGATLGELVQNSPINLEGVGGTGTAGGAGGAGGNQIVQGEAPKLQAVGIYINGSYVDLPVSDNTVVIDIPSLSQQFSASASIDGFTISASTSGSSITSSTGRIEVGEYYSFPELEAQLGLIKEIAEEVGISPSFVVEQLLGGGTITMGSLLDNYALGKDLAVQLGYDLQDSYTFERYLTSSQGVGEAIYITLNLQ